jgi:hypothetical protein
MNWDVDLTKVVIPLIHIVGNLGAGLLIEKNILLKLRKASNKTKLKEDDIIINSFRGITAKEIMQNTEGGIKNFEPFIRYHTFGELGITILRGRELVSQYLIKHEFIKALHMQFH